MKTFLGLLRVVLAAALAPFAVLLVAAMSYMRRRRIRSKALAPGTVTELVFEDGEILALTPSSPVDGAPSMELRLAGKIRSTRMGPSGVEVTDRDGFDLRLPLDPGLMVVLSALHGQGLRLAGDVRILSAPHADLVSVDQLERVRLTPEGGGPEIILGRG